MLQAVLYTYICTYTWFFTNICALDRINFQGIPVVISNNSYFLTNVLNQSLIMAMGYGSDMYKTAATHLTASTHSSIKTRFMYNKGACLFRPEVVIFVGALFTTRLHIGYSR